MTPLLWCPAASSAFKSLPHLPTTATRSGRFICHRQRSHRSPVAVSNKIFGLSLILDFVDRCHSLRSLYLPQAALPSLPLREGGKTWPPR